MYTKRVASEGLALIGRENTMSGAKLVAGSYYIKQVYREKARLEVLAFWLTREYTQYI